MKTKKSPAEKQEEQPTAPENMKVEYTNAFVLKGNALKPFSTDQETAAKISQDKQSLEKKFKSKKELTEIVLNNGKILFGEKTLLVDLHKQQIIANLSGGFYPDGILLETGEKPKLYLVEAILSEENLAELFVQLTQLFSFFKNKESIGLFRESIGKAVNSNIGLRNKLKKLLGEKSIPAFLEEAIKEKPPVLLVMDSFKQELTGFMETYTETWGKYVKPILLRKFAFNGDTIVTMVPTLAELNQKLNGRKNSSAEKVVKNTEEDHLQSTSETMKEIFLQLKAELLIADKELEFRVKKHYISLRKGRNLAFFQLGKKKLTIVIANPEEKMQFKIKHHKTLNLAASVKKFWNGNEHCFTVVIEAQEHLGEITQLLKKLVAGGEESDVAAEETAGKSQAKPKRKGKK